MTAFRGKMTAFAVAAGSIVLDQLTKVIASGSLQQGVPVPLLGSVIRLMLRYNEGAAFSFSWGGPMVLAVLSCAAAVFIVVFVFRCRKCTTGMYVSLGAVLGGAVGNLVDRILSGKVIDFIDVGLSGWRWPTFNVADISICVGGIMLLLLYRGGKDEDTADEGQVPA